MGDSKIHHHFNPIFYLNGFTDKKGKLCVYYKNKIDSFDNVQCNVSPKSVGFEKNGYTLKLLNGEKDSESIENFLKNREDRVAPLLKKIRDNDVLTDLESSLFIEEFIALMAVRTPASREMIKAVIKEVCLKAKNKEDFEQYLKKEMDKGYHDIKIDDFESERQKFIAIDKTIEMNIQTSHIIIPFFIFPEKIKDLKKLKWQFLKATDDCKFLTGDNPFIYMKDRNDDKSDFFGMALSSEIFILGSSRPGIQKEFVKKFSNKDIRELNKTTVRFARLQVYYHCKAQNIYELVKKYKDECPGMN